MIPSGCMKLLLPVTAILIFVFSTSCSKQCKPTPSEGDSSVIIRNVGIKLCQLKCDESGQCLRIQYNSDTLTCRLLREESRKTEMKEGYVSRAGNHPDVQTGSCSSKMCSIGKRCLKTRSGKFVCVQDGEQNYPGKSPQHQVNKEETFGNSSLHEACRKGNLTRVKRILSQGLLDINIRDANLGKTPLMVAAQEGHCSIFSFLISKGADKSQVDADGKNFLHWACKGGHEGMLECLLPQNSTFSDNMNFHPLLDAALQGYRDVCEFLVCMGANVSVVNYQGDNALHFGCQGGHLDVVKYLLSLCRLDINSRGHRGWTPLMVAAVRGHIDMFEFLARMGANASLVDDYKNNVLHLASKRGHEKVVKYIIYMNMVNIKARNRRGKTAAMNAKHKQRIYVFLLQNGCPRE